LRRSSFSAKKTVSPPLVHRFKGQFAEKLFILRRTARKFEVCTADTCPLDVGDRHNWGFFWRERLTLKPKNSGKLRYVCSVYHKIVVSAIAVKRYAAGFLESLLRFERLVLEISAEMDGCVAITFTECDYPLRAFRHLPHRENGSFHSQRFEYGAYRIWRVRKREDLPDKDSGRGRLLTDFYRARRRSSF
jgi:hypothetical protein